MVFWGKCLSFGGQTEAILSEGSRPYARQGSFTAENAVGVVEANLAIDEEFEQARRAERAEDLGFGVLGPGSVVVQIVDETLGVTCTSVLRPEVMKRMNRGRTTVIRD